MTGSSVAKAVCQWNSGLPWSLLYTAFTRLQYRRLLAVLPIQNINSQRQHLPVGFSQRPARGESGLFTFSRVYRGGRIAGSVPDRVWADQGMSSASRSE